MGALGRELITSVVGGTAPSEAISEVTIKRVPKSRKLKSQGGTRRADPKRSRAAKKAAAKNKSARARGAKKGGKTRKRKGISKAVGRHNSRRNSLSLFNRLSNDTSELAPYGAISLWRDVQGSLDSRNSAYENNNQYIEDQVVLIRRAVSTESWDAVKERYCARLAEAANWFADEAA